MKSEYPDMINKLIVTRVNLRDALEYVSESIELLQAKYAKECAQAIDVLANV
jgi:hypothetical protein